ncbi:Putative proline-rich receptor-like protein kinase PERK11 [Apostasia shenzhenica]|uniref:Proline-rich receptor-like protein kinase PERK11 n=1 Tax=Apostasia shenzhenica TaxID=1088818 RepID=A0A2I0BAT1_9ASPA|nr:Putative proline-rich receptor-like protein kinase PERK11 [Apostasia shenzhenica]
MGISQSTSSRRNGIALPAPVGHRWRVGGEGGDGGRGNEAWLLAEAWKEQEGVEPQSVHSSFRFSFGSQTEAEVDETPAVAPATVLLLVNAEDKRDAPAGASAVGMRVRRKINTEEATGEHQRRRWRLDSLEQSISPAAGGLVRFSYDEMRLATRGFSKRRELGRGALSRVYKGKIGGVLARPTVAIKRVDGPERESAKAFCRELLIASSLCSPFIVPLLGYCIDREGLFLVYKYVSGGSLDLFLHGNEKKRKVLRWKVRYKVAIGIARAVEYLHFGNEKCVVHRDIKPSNILLSPNKNPMLCDFGLATWTHGPSLPFLCKEVKGTFGYLAPEYFQHGKLSDKTDVYAFGIVLLELITGRKAIDQNRPQGDENLVLWAKPHLLQGEVAIEKLVDPRMRPGSYRWSEMRRMVRAAGACLSCADSARPNIGQVLAILLEKEGNAGLEWPMFSSSGCLSDYHEPQDELDIKSYLSIAMLGVSENGGDDSGYSERELKLL